VSHQVFDLHVPRKRFSLSCVVPVYNEGASISRFITELHANLLELTSEVEIIVVNDGSTDNSAQQILDLCTRLPVQYIELSRNFGKEFALQAGLDAVNGDCALILDADFQHPMQAIAPMVERWLAGTDMVYAIKANRNNESLFNKLGARLFYQFLLPQRGVKIPANAGDFRLLDRRVVEALRALPERNRFMKGLYAWVGFKSEAVEFTAVQRASGSSKFGKVKLLNLAITGVTSFSNTPLRVVTMVGAVISTFALLMGVWIIVEKIFLRQPIAGFATLAAAIFFFSGVQLIALGVVGEYVGRIFDEVKQRPRYVVARKVNQSPLVATPRRRRSDQEERAGA
jgi:glycosyltransferase involved in cell wall biosynthesis